LAFSALVQAFVVAQQLSFFVAVVLVYCALAVKVPAKNANAIIAMIFFIVIFI
jgi:hypothetical protein